MTCDNCGRPVRLSRGLHFNAYRHDDNDPWDASAEWCGTKDGYVRVTVNGQDHR